jgi:glycosyltransferase involved in cell wall biosynthesis
MNDSVTICIGTIGSPTFAKCKRIIDSIARKDPRVKRVIVISNKRPQSAWLNAMREQCVDTKWCLQIDEDMYLHENALSKLIKFAKSKEREGVKILNASSLLYDLFLRQNIGSLKLWSSEALQSQGFRDVLGGDRDYAKRAKKNGFRNVEISVVLGGHDSAPNEKIAYKKYFEYVQKIKKFKKDSSARSFVKSMKRKHANENTKITKAVYKGSKAGLNSPILDESKS